MKKEFLSTAFLMLLNACANKIEPRTFFIDSNVTADVYVGDVKIGTTPFQKKLNREQAPLLNLRRDGYKPAKIKVPLGHYRSPLFDTTSSNCYQLKKENGTNCTMMTVGATFIISYGLGLTMTTGLESAESGYYEYAKNAFYVEMMPLKKKQLSQNDLKNLQIKSFILQNYAPLNIGNSEYMLTLEKLSGFVPDRPLPDQTAPQYVNTFFHQKL